jgi:hypothetical protein
MGGWESNSSLHPPGVLKKLSPLAAPKGHQRGIEGSAAAPRTLELGIRERAQVPLSHLQPLAPKLRPASSPGRMSWGQWETGQTVLCCHLNCNIEGPGGRALPPALQPSLG